MITGGRDMTNKEMLNKGTGLVKWRAYIWKKNSNITLTYDEIVSAGNIGLANALRKYNNDKGVKFTTYAITCIDNQIKKELNSYTKYNKHVHICDMRLHEEYSVVPSYLDNDNTIVVREAIEKLDAEEQKIIYMIYYENRTYTYIIKELNTTRDKLKVKHKNILKKLKEFLSE